MATHQKKNILYTIMAILFLAALSTQAFAALDISSPFICAFTKSFDCDNAEGCQEATSDSLGLPPFIKIDIAKNLLTAAVSQKAESRTETPIKSFHEVNGKLILQGIERRGWSAVIDKETGHMTVAASTDNEAVVLFGVCTAQ